MPLQLALMKRTKHVHITNSSVLERKRERVCVGGGLNLTSGASFSGFFTFNFILNTLRPSKLPVGKHIYVFNAYYLPFTCTGVDTGAGKDFGTGTGAASGVCL